MIADEISLPWVLIAERICVTVAGASKGKPCIFPFKFNGVLYSECTWNQAHLTEHKAWCSTLVDASGTHVGGQGKWGNCGPGCPVPPDDRPGSAGSDDKPGSGRPTAAPTKTDGKNQMLLRASIKGRMRYLSHGLVDLFTHFCVVVTVCNCKC